jgi:hypothetical protein
MSDKHEKLIDDPEEEIIKFNDDKSVSEIEPNFIIRQNNTKIIEDQRRHCCIIL